jgi:transketolase
VTTGPLGQGVGNAVGMAMASRYERGLLDPDAPAARARSTTPIWCIASDGDLQEGISARPARSPGHQRLGNLVVLYDDNHISIEGDTQTAFSEDVMGRYAAYGWHVPAGRGRQRRRAAARRARRRPGETDRPSFIAMRTIIGYPAPNLQNTGKAHGAALGKDEVALTKEAIGFPTDTHFYAPDEVVAHARRSSTAGGRRTPSGRSPTTTGRRPTRAQGAARPPAGPPAARRLDQGRCPSSTPTPRGSPPARRAARSSRALGEVIPELWGGSADLAESNNTPSTRARRSCPRATRSRAPTRTAGPCTSASASTPWVP